MKKTLIVGALALSSLAFFSCSNGGNKSGADSTAVGHAKNAITLDSTALNFHHGGGQRVPMGR
jgi:ABC-type Fe3+-citrate transport system substrate-binding protein